MSVNKGSGGKWVIRLLVVVVLLFVAWQILLSDTVSNALLAFLLDGVVPGTKTVIAPETMILGVEVLAAVCVVMLGARAWFVHRRTKRATRLLTTQSLTTEQAASSVEPITGKNVAIQKAAEVKKVKKPIKPPTVPPRVRIGLAALNARLSPSVQRTGRTIGINLIGMYELTYIFVCKIGRKIKRRSVVVSRKTAQTMRVFWRHAKPRLVQGSDWLDRQIGRMQSSVIRWLQ